MGRLCLPPPALLAFLAGALPAHAWTWPASGPVLQHFSYGWRHRGPRRRAAFRGVDVGGSFGEPVLAPAAGQVSFCRHGAGRRVARSSRIRTPDGFAVTLLHLGTISVTKGAALTEGARVGTLGCERHRASCRTLTCIWVSDKRRTRPATSIPRASYHPERPFPRTAQRSSQPPSPPPPRAPPRSNRSRLGSGSASIRARDRRARKAPRPTLHPVPPHMHPR